jgi:hypothetical protein
MISKLVEGCKLKKIIILLVILFLLTGCNKNIQTSELSGLSEKEIQKLDVDEDIKEIAQDSIAEPLPLSSNDKIENAYNNNEISKQEWALLTFISSYIPEQLPEQYQGEEAINLRNQLQEAKWWLNENYNDLDEEWQEKFEPFYVLPDNPKSIFNIDDNDFLEELLIIPSVEANSGWQNFQAQISLNPDRRVKIFYKPENKQKALYVNETIHKAWMMHENLLGLRPEKMVYLYIKPMSNGAGEAEMKYAGNTDRCVIGLNQNTGKKEMQSTAAHELFHCFQFYIPLKYVKEEDMWLMEATASWSESYVYPDYNIEWMYLPYQFKNLHTHLIEHNGEKEYSSYLWYYFLTQYTGDLNQIKKPLIEAKDYGGRAAATGIDYFQQLWAEYALWLWNKDPEKRFTDDPYFPEKHKGVKTNPQGQNLDSREFSTQEEFPLYEPVKPLSTTYAEAIFPSEEVKKVVFKFRKEGNDYHRRQALIKIGDVWHWEDWTYITERKFCRSRDEEFVKAVVLVLSNSEPDKTEDDYEEFYKIDTRGECSPEWHGHTTWHYSDSWTDSIDGGALLSAEMGYSMNTKYNAYETLVYDEEEDEFVVKDQFLTFNRLETSHAVNLNDCGTMNKGSVESWKGTTSKSWNIDKKHPADSDAPTRMRVSRDDPAKYYVNVEVVSGDEFITHSDMTYSKYKPCPLEGLFTPVGGQSSSSRKFSKTSRLPSYPNDILADLEQDGNSIKGYVDRDIGDYTIHIEVDYRYN